MDDRPFWTTAITLDQALSIIYFSLYFSGSVNKTDYSQKPIMEPTHYDRLAELTENLSRKELKAGREHLRRFHYQKRKSGSLSELLDKVVRDRKLSVDAFFKKHYEKRISRKAFFQNCRRAQKKLVEGLLMDPVTEDPDSFSLTSRVKLRVNKELLSCRILISRGCPLNAFELLKRSIRDAQRLELFDELIEALTIERNISGTRYGAERFRSYDDRIAFYETCRDALSRALDYYHRFFIEFEDFEGNNNKKVGFLTEALSQLEADHRKTASIRVEEFLLELRILYSNAVEEYQQSCRTGRRLLELVKNSEALYTERKEADIRQDLADNHLFTRELGPIEELLELPLQVYPKGDFDHLQTMEVLFLKNHYAGETERAHEVLESHTIPLTAPQNTPFLANKWEYYRAVLCLLRGEPKRGLKCLERTELLDSDKEGWNLWIRFLGIMCSIEADDPDRAEHRSESARKDLERIVKAGGEPHMRERIILRVLRALEVLDHDLGALLEERKEDLELLRSDRKELRWEPKTPELIVFQDWVEDRAQGRPYRFRYPRTVTPHPLSQARAKEGGRS
jgi:tetratricopeptide (TPR) repeat protein